ncbi:G-protein coupled receptor 161-like [Strongylocentrotus purpuratus]|uniref:G-protein coupled receptors family 1 profile domain-containing protein n=1 Tax=Strongylocentrotus purpuratus TaxID=7668 RepID=A0A7M7GJ09_STRPU|nr:G-protein coupled receptor 161-like [Strongylocentrotus purpuratus]|eukprot:XP_003729483.1 PREDICTED: G-protein coupled receptor 161-like [Strongylocentrotus purpuratus]
MATTASINGSDSPSWSWNEIDWGDWHTILQLVPACIGCLGNLVVIIVLIPPRSQNRSTDILIGHLAVADFLTSIFLLPIPVVRTVPRNWLGVLYCGFLGLSSCRIVCIFSAIYILLAICCDRFLAVVYPLQFNRWITRWRATLVVVCIWLGSSIGQYTTTFTRLDRAKYECTVISLRRYSQITAGSLNFLFVFAVPALTMLLSQIFIARTLLRQSRRFNSDRNLPPFRPSVHLVARRKVLKMMAIAVAVFVVTLGPNQTSYYCYNLGIVPQGYLSGDFHRFTILLLATAPALTLSSTHHKTRSSGRHL